MLIRAQQNKGLYRSLFTAAIRCCMTLLISRCFGLTHTHQSFPYRQKRSRLVPAFITESIRPCETLVSHHYFSSKNRRIYPYLRRFSMAFSLFYLNSVFPDLLCLAFGRIRWIFSFCCRFFLQIFFFLLQYFQQIDPGLVFLLALSFGLSFTGFSHQLLDSGDTLI